MCRRVTCPSCRKPTFAGCGLHVEQVLGDVPPEERCKCNEKLTIAPGATRAPRSIWKRLRG